MGMFVIGGALSIWEGIQALLDPPELEAFWVGVGVLVIALVLDAGSRFVAVRTLRRQASRRKVSMRQLLRESPDPTVVTVYFEDTIDVLGAALALLALVLHRITGSALPDALATLVIGVMLGFVALRLTARNRDLLTNQAVPERYVAWLRERLLAMPGIEGVDNLHAVYLGPGDVLVTGDVTLAPCQDATEVVTRLEHAKAEIGREAPAISRFQLTPVAVSEPPG